MNATSLMIKPTMAKKKSKRAVLGLKAISAIVVSKSETLQDELAEYICKGYELPDTSHAYAAAAEDPLRGTDGLKDKPTCPDPEQYGFGYIIWYLSGCSRELFERERGVWRLLKTEYDWIYFLKHNPEFLTDYAAQREYILNSAQSFMPLIYMPILPFYFGKHNPIERHAVILELLNLGLKIDCVKFTHSVLMMKALDEPGVQRDVACYMREEVPKNIFKRSMMIICRRLKIKMTCIDWAEATLSPHNLDVCRVLLHDRLVTTPSGDVDGPFAIGANNAIILFILKCSHLSPVYLRSLFKGYRNIKELATLAVIQMLIKSEPRYTDSRFEVTRNIIQAFSPDPGDVKNVLLRYSTPADKVHSLIEKAGWTDC